MNKKILVDVIGILLLALVVVVGYKLSPLLLPKADLTVQPAAGCDLNRQACAAELPDGGRVELSSDVRPIPMVQPFHVELTVSGLQPTQVEVDFAGVDMNMGLNRPRLQPVGDGRFVGEVSLPVCVTGQMDWQVTVLVETARQRLAIPYRLSAAAAHGL
ncbi:MAG: hypothetical protein ACM3X0_08960 [Bacteroidota bacterium]